MASCSVFRFPGLLDGSTDRRTLSSASDRLFISDSLGFSSARKMLSRYQSIFKSKITFGKRDNGWILRLCSWNYFPQVCQVLNSFIFGRGVKFVQKVNSCHNLVQCSSAIRRKVRIINLFLDRLADNFREGRFSERRLEIRRTGQRCLFPSHQLPFRLFWSSVYRQK